MNTFYVHSKRGKESGKYNVSLLELAPEAQGFTKLDKRNKGILVLKQWLNVYIGKTSACAGNKAKLEANAIKAALEKAGFESAKALHVTGVFKRPHNDLISFLELAASADCSFEGW